MGEFSMNVGIKYFTIFETLNILLHCKLQIIKGFGYVELRFKWTDFILGDV